VSNNIHNNQLLNHRQLIQLQGSLSWCYEQCVQLITRSALPYFWLGDAPEKISSSLYKQLLGQETSLLFINAHQQFDANVFAASEGTLRGGGTLILISPTEASRNDHFYRYIMKHLQNAHFKVIKEQQNTLTLAHLLPQQDLSLHLKQQQHAVAAILKTVTGHRRRPLVLTANRGRGKSSALGLAAKQLIASGIENILVCAPNKNATATLFKHSGESTQITFIAPDRLLSDKPPCDLLMIDEAAALPVPLLEALTKHYSRIVFATTLHGYEGSGRGFALRFQKRLKEIAPQSRSMHLDQPIRWDKGDPLEQFTLQRLCLTESATPLPQYDTQQPIDFSVISAQQLCADDALLTELFSLLVIAHYQTKPSDLEKLLNDTALSIFILKQQGQLLAVALVSHEGDIEAELAQQIYLGERRLPGHLVAQSLAFHCAQPQAATHRYARIQRIATHPALQQQGLGQYFIDKLSTWANEQQFDHLCASFGATASLLSFWQTKQFQTLRIGSSKDKSSGTYSFIVNRPLSQQGKVLHQQLLQQFHAQLITQLTRHLQDIDAELILRLVMALPKRPLAHPLLRSYCLGNVPYEFAETQLIQVITHCDLSLLAKSEQKLTIQKILQNKSWADVCQNNAYTGKKQAQQVLRTSIRQLSTQFIEE